MDWLINDEEKVEELGPPWEVLIVDDDQQIHQVTKLALKNFIFDNRQLNFVSVYSGAEAMKVLDTSKTEFAIILLDVVMEENDSGLKIANYIRNTQNNHYTRIILRTGQAGLAPEYSVVKNYDIDSYKSKTELKLADLEAIFYTTLRSYRDIVTIKNQRESLHQVVSSITKMNSAKDLSDFASAILDQIQLLIGCENGELLLENSESYAICKKGEKTKILAVSNNGENLIDDNLKMIIDKSFKEHENYNKHPYFVHFFETLRKNEIVLSLKSKKEVTSEDSELLNLFSANVALTYENLLLGEEVNNSQKKLVSLLGAAMENGSKVTKSHLFRVGESSALLATLYGMDSDNVEKLKVAAQLHDIGNVAIDDKLLNRPGKLSDEEMKVVQEHTTNGYNILSSTDIPMIVMGANITLEHHEWWDGSGYPQGKKGDEISLEARVVAIADVFDALLSKRPYREAWKLEDVQQYIEDRKAIQFDPHLVDIFMKNREKFSKIYSDIEV